MSLVITQLFGIENSRVVTLVLKNSDISQIVDFLIETSNCVKLLQYIKDV